MRKAFWIFNVAWALSTDFIPKNCRLTLLVGLREKHVQIIDFYLLSAALLLLTLIELSQSDFRQVLQFPWCHYGWFVHIYIKFYSICSLHSFVVHRSIYTHKSVSNYHSRDLFTYFLLFEMGFYQHLFVPFRICTMSIRKVNQYQLKLIDSHCYFDHMMGVTLKFAYKLRGFLVSILWQ